VDEETMQEEPKVEVDPAEMTDEQARELLRKLSIPDDVSEELIGGWKAEFPTCEVYAMRFSEKEAYIFRTMTRFEYKQLLKAAQSTTFQTPQDLEMYNEETIVEKCVLFPKINKVDMESMKAGTISLLADSIMNASGFNPMGGPVRL
jgi:hypothetical protein